MNIKGTAMVAQIMSQMVVGQKGFLTTDAIMVINNEEIFIIKNSSVSDTKHGEKYILPIKRTGEGEEDFEIDFNIAYYFYNNKVSIEEKEGLKKNHMIGPYPIQTEIYQPSKYRVQTYPRMDIEELLGSLAETNIELEEDPESDIDLEDREILRKLIKKQLFEKPLPILKNLEKCFIPASEKELEEGIVNPIADEVILNYIQKRIEKLQKEENYDGLSLDDLNIRLKDALDKSDFEKAAIIRDLIKNYKKVPVEKEAS